MSGNNLGGKNLSPEEGSKIKKIVEVIVDILVSITGGKPTFGKK